MGIGWPWHGTSACWIAPAPQEELAAKWVEDVARDFRKPQFRNIFMNIPGGSPQSTILGLLNEAALGLESGEPEYARQLVRRAVNVLDRSAGRGWYTESDIQPIQALILKYAKKGFAEADQNWKTRNKNSRNNMNRSSNQNGNNGVGLFNPEEPNFSGTRWDGYTSGHWQGGEGGSSRNGRQNNQQMEDAQTGDRARKGSFENRNRNTMRSPDNNSRMERGGTQRYYSDDFYYSHYPWEDREKSFQGDIQGKSRRTSLRDLDSDRDRMPRSMEQDRRQHARGKARFYQEQPEDSGRERRFDRGPGQDQYFESTTRHESRGYEQ